MFVNSDSYILSNELFDRPVCLTYFLLRTFCARICSKLFYSDTHTHTNTPAQFQKSTTHARPVHWEWTYVNKSVGNWRREQICSNIRAFVVAGTGASGVAKRKSYLCDCNAIYVCFEALKWYVFEMIMWIFSFVSTFSLSLPSVTSFYCRFFSRCLFWTSATIFFNWKLTHKNRIKHLAWLNDGNLKEKSSHP